MIDIHYKCGNGTHPRKLRRQPQTTILQICLSVYTLSSINEGNSVLHNGVALTARHLNDSIDATDKNNPVCEDDTCQETFAVLGFSEDVRRFVEFVSVFSGPGENVVFAIKPKTASVAT